MSFVLVPLNTTPISLAGMVLPPLGRNVFTCHYTSQANSGNTSYTFGPCGFTPIAKAEIHPSFGKYIARRMAIDIPHVVLAGYYPKVGDYFAGPDGKTYHVMDCQSPAIFTQRVVGICPEISFPLEDTVQYYQVTIAGASSTGARTIVETATGSPVAAAIVPDDSLFGEQFGTLNMGETYLVFLDSDPSGNGPSIIKAGDLLVDQNAVKYEIQEVFDRNRLDAKPTMRVVKKL